MLSKLDGRAWRWLKPPAADRFEPVFSRSSDPDALSRPEDFAEMFRKQKAWDVDVWVSAHGSQYGLHDKYEPGQDYSPETFVDPEGFLAEVERLEKLYLDQMAAERR